MLGAYLSSLLLFLQLAHAVTNSSSSVSYSTSTLQITSFLTVTAPRPTGSGNALSNATGLEQASSCNQAKLDWIEDRGQTYVSNSTFQTSTSSVSFAIIRSGWIETYGPTEVYALCDRYPRMNASTEFKTTETTPQQTIWSTFTTQTEVYRNVSAPTCTIGQQACSALDAEYSSSLTAYSNYASQPISETVWPSVASPMSPICGSVTLPPESSTTLAPAACVYNHATIQLLYWPVSTVGNHICGNNWTTVEATPTIEGKPNTAVGFNTTFTSPTVYMVLSGAYEVGDNYATGTAINGILPMASDAVSSMCAGPGGVMGSPEAMDYADFDAPIPKSKYLCQPACWTKPDYPQSWTNSAYNITATENQCTTIYDGVYKPALQVPVEEFNSFYANFTNGVGLDFGGLQCSFSPGTDGIFYDPPSALQQVQSAVGPSAPNVPGATTTAAGDPQTTPAAPAPTVPTALPQTTGGGGDVPQPTQPSELDPSGEEEDDDEAPSDPPSDSSDDGDGDDNASDPEEPAENGGSGSGNNDDNDEAGQAGSDPSGGDGSPDDVGGIIASIIGAAPAPAEQSPSPDGSPDSQDGSTSPDSSNSDPSNPPADQNSSDSSADSNAAGAGTSPNDQPSPSSNGGSPNEGQPILLTGTDGDIVTANPSGSALILPSATLTPGQQASLAGIGSISIATDGIVQHGQTIQYPTQAPSVGDQAYVVDGQTYTADGSSNVVVAPGQTLTAGGCAVTIDGTTYSLAASSDGGSLLVNGATATRTDLGGGSASTSSGAMQQTGNAASGLFVRSEGSNPGLALGLSGLLALL